MPNISEFLLVAAITLAVMHFGVPLGYYIFLTRKWLRRPWGLRFNEGYMPRVTIVIPTYNEAGIIKAKLDNIYEQEYPRDKLEVIVVDSASTDGTSEKVREWAAMHPELNLKLIEEPVRRGKAHALNKALQKALGAIFIITDADAQWIYRDTLKRLVKWFSNASVGAVSCLKRPHKSGPAGVEEGYRNYYNIVRLAESKAWATPIFHGELAAYKKHLLESIGGFPLDVGADDSHTATRIALAGYRAITPDDIYCTELIPKKGYTAWRIRRAQHLLQHFIKILRLKYKLNKNFRIILIVEEYLHLMNPWLLVGALMLALTSAALGNDIAGVLLLLAVAALAINPYRTWLVTQIYLVLAFIKNIFTKELIWEKQSKT